MDGRVVAESYHVETCFPVYWFSLNVETQIIHGSAVPFVRPFDHHFKGGKLKRGTNEQGIGIVCNRLADLELVYLILTGNACVHII